MDEQTYREHAKHIENHVNYRNRKDSIEFIVNRLKEFYEIAANEGENYGYNQGFNAGREEGLNGCEEAGIDFKEARDER